MFNTETFKALLASKNMKQSDIARMTGIPRNSICRYASGKTQPSAKYSILIAGAMDVSVEVLIIKESSESLPQTTTPTATPKRKLCFCPSCGVSLSGVAE